MSAHDTHAGVFITFEGGEGSGKSTQARVLGQRLSALGTDVRVLREPGSTRVGEAIRKILLDPAGGDMDARAELLLFEAARAQHTAEVIEPALDAGDVVLCDRYYDSSTAYQGYGRGLPLDEVRGMNAAATGGLVPDLTIVIDVDPADVLGRAINASGQADRLEAEDAAFHQRVRDGYLAIARDERERVVVIPGGGTVDEVAERVLHAVRASGVLAGVLPPQ